MSDAPRGDVAIRFVGDEPDPLNASADDAFAPNPEPEPNLALRAGDASVWLVLLLFAYIAVCYGLGTLIARFAHHVVS